jgi:hypothetical protein
MSTVDNMRTFSFSYICDLAEFYGIALMLLAARMKCYGCIGIRLLFFLLPFLETWIESCLLNASFIFASLLYLIYRTKNLCY